MKTKVIIIAFLSSFLFFSLSCEKEKTIDKPTGQSNHEIVASWNLVKCEGGFSPIDIFTDEIQWTFVSNNTISVVIKDGTEIKNQNLPLSVNGVYSYSLNDSTLTIPDNQDYYYRIIGDTLILSSSKSAPADCGTLISFLKQE